MHLDIVDDMPSDENDDDDNNAEFRDDEPSMSAANGGGTAGYMRTLENRDELYRTSGTGSKPIFPRNIPKTSLINTANKESSPMKSAHKHADSLQGAHAQIFMNSQVLRSTIQKSA